MAIEDVSLSLRVEGWSQTITHGERWPELQFRVDARTQEDEEMLIGAEGHHRLRDMPVQLSLVRGEPEKALDRGIGILAFYPERPSRGDIDGMAEFVGGWFWLPGALYDEIWQQAREHRYDECLIEIEFGPVDWGSYAPRWNVEKSKTAAILRAGARFERRLSPPAARDPSLTEPAKRRGLFGLGG